MPEDTDETAPAAPTKRSRWTRLALGALGYAVIAVFAFRTIDHDRFLEGLRRLRPEHAAVILLVSLVHIAGRALRYHALLTHEGPRDYGWFDGVRIFLAGLSLSAVTPARAGDLIKAQLVRRHGVSASAGVGIVMVERVLDLIIVATAIAVSGALLSGRAAADTWRGASLLLLASLVAGVALLSVRRARTPLLNAVARVASRVRRKSTPERVLALLEDLFKAWDAVFRSPARLAAYLLASAGVWAVEFVKLGIVLRLMGLSVEPQVIFFVYPVSIVAGILTIMPFSEGVVGLTGVALLAALSPIDAGTATVAVVVDRAASVLPPLCLWGVWSLFAAPRLEPVEPVEPVKPVEPVEPVPPKPAPDPR